MSYHTLVWQVEAVDDVIGLAMSLEARELKLLLDNVPLLMNDPKPINARQKPNFADVWELPVDSVIVEYEVANHGIIAIRRVRSETRESSG